MTVSSVNNTADNSATTSIGKLNADFDMFLKLLTAQMQNQDPLDPMDTSEYTQQLVQYSQVEQAIEQTGTLKDILAGMGSQDLSQASALIGREVELDSEVAGLSSDAPAVWAWNATRDVTSLTATITDANGKVIETRKIDATSSSGRFEWDGSLATGGKAAAGAYVLTLEGVDANGVKIGGNISTIGKVQEVRSSGGVITLGLNGIQLPMSSVLRVSNAAG